MRTEGSTDGFPETGKEGAGEWTRNVETQNEI